MQVKVEPKFEEVGALEIKLRGGDSLLLACCYRSPTKTDSSTENSKKLNDFIDWCSKKKHSHKLIIGDFNYKHINWKNWTSDTGLNSDENQFLDTLSDAFLYQHVEKPTRRRGMDEPRLLDLILTNEPMQISNLCHNSPLGKSDHDVLLFKYHAYIDHSKPQPKYNYGKSNYEAMKNELRQENWSQEFLNAGGNLNIEEVWKTLSIKYTYFATNSFQ